jgi:hypothetical protein
MFANQNSACIFHCHQLYCMSHCLSS